MLGEFEDDDDYAFLNDMPVPGGPPPSVPGTAPNNNNSPVEEEKKADEEEEDPNAHKLEYD